MPQLELFEHRRGLFQPAAVKEAMARDASRRAPPISATDRVKLWNSRLESDEKRADLGEQQHKQTFLRDIFEGLLDYKTLGEADPYQLNFEVSGPADSRPADGALGTFGTADKTVVRAVIEMKGPGVDLDARSNRKDHLSPVDQAFLYASHQENCWWVIVSNFDEIRLYHHQRGASVFERFLLADLAALGEEFERFRFLLSRERLVGDDSAKPLALTLAEQKWRAQAEITKTFYAEYQEARVELFRELRRQNAGEDPLEVLEATQRLLDRLLFTMFCADRGLLPRDVIENVRRTADPRQNYAYGPSTLWTATLGLFDSINQGREAAGIPGYNGGLFAPALLDGLTLDDPGGEKGAFVLRRVLKWDALDFESQIDVDILGHIFENSVSDLEQLRAEIVSDPTRLRLSWRNQEGIFYTPEWVTSYIVAHAAGRYLDDHPEVGPDFKVLDPACGSGAFLTQLIPILRSHLDQVAPEEAQKVREARKEYGEALSLFRDPSRLEPEALYAAIQRSVFGVDRSRESIEITRLSFWLQTVVHGHPLPRLDENIRNGNSLVRDAGAAPDAFPWREAFPALAEDGANAVVGNPPWVTTRVEYADALEDCYRLAEGQYDLAWVFLEASLERLKPGGVLGFIVPDSILFNEETEAVRRMLAEEHTLLEVIKLGEGVFPGVFRGSVIVVVRKGEPPEGHTFDGLVVTKEDRREITDVASSANLDVLMTQRGSTIPLRRILKNPACELDIFVGQEDETLLATIQDGAIPLGDLVEHGRGIELNSSGHVVRCPHCFKWDAPPLKRKGVYKTKTCAHCGAEYEKEDALSEAEIITPWTDERGAAEVPFVDGTDVNRYRITGRRLIDTSRDGINYKDPSLYRSPKVLWRQTGVGITATIDYDLNAYVPQSVYILRLKEEAPGDLSRYRLEYLLGLLNSRVMLYRYFKKTAALEWQSFPRWTLGRVTSLPIRAIDWSDAREARLHDEIAEAVEQLIRRGATGAPDEDLHIERLVMDLYGLGSDERQRVWETLRTVQELKVIREVLPPQQVSAELARAG